MSEGKDEKGSATSGAQFGKYRIVRKMGEGSFGAVYEALLPGPMGFAKQVAIKRLRPGVVGPNHRFAHALVNEARIGALLHHAHIVDVLEFGQVGEQYYLAMEFVDGATLAEIIQLCRQRKVLLPRFAIVDLGTQICRGLHYAHTLEGRDGRPLDLIHRDLKPSNIIVDREGTARILDFGIAKAASNLFNTTAAGMTKGTPFYMSPEQLQGQTPLRPRSDVFSLGAVLYELITGRILFHGGSLEGIIHQITAADLSERLEEAEAAFIGCRPLLERALHRDPDRRYQDARSLGKDLSEMGRSYPPEADMSEVIGRLIPALDRTESRVIAGSDDLTLEEDPAPPISSDVALSSEGNPIPAPGPDSSGWHRFSAAFHSVAAEDELADVTPVAPTSSSSASTHRRPVGLWAVVGLVVLGFLVICGWGLSRAVNPGTNGEPTSSMVEKALVPDRRDPTPVAEVSASDEGDRVAVILEDPREDPPTTPAQEVRQEEVTAPPPSLLPGTIAVEHVKPWAMIYVDDDLAEKSANKMRPYSVEGGTHTVRFVCPPLDGKEKIFHVEVDGDSVVIPCWDFNSMAHCEQGGPRG